jgi:hypothetical protein
MQWRDRAIDQTAASELQGYDIVVWLLILELHVFF